MPECYMTPAQNHRVGTEPPLLHIQECEAAGCSVLGKQECLMLQSIARRPRHLKLKANNAMWLISSGC